MSTSHKDKWSELAWFLTLITFPITTPLNDGPILEYEHSRPKAVSFSTSSSIEYLTAINSFNHFNETFIF